jgi:hypothetical protein
LDLFELTAPEPVRARRVTRDPALACERAYFEGPEEAFDWLERRGYRLTRLGNWLPPANLSEPSQKDLVAANHLYRQGPGRFGGIIRLRRCPFCGGQADAHTADEVECMECGGTAADVESWQRRV